MTEPTYNRTTWHDAPSTASPIDEDNLNNIEQGIVDAITRAAASVRYDAAQSLNPTQQAIARANIGAGSVTINDTAASTSTVYSSTKTNTAIAAAIAALVGAAPGALDTLNELAAALGDDANYAATITTALAGKQPLDSDLTAIAALTTTTYGRSLLTAADAAAARTLIGTAAPTGATTNVSYNMVASDEVIVGNGSSITIGLPDPTTVTAWKRYYVKNIHSSTATLNSQGTSKTIDGVASVSLVQWQAYTVVSDGAQWLIV